MEKRRPTVAASATETLPAPADEAMASVRPGLVSLQAQPIVPMFVLPEIEQPEEPSPAPLF
jgi:hypothetical protein